VSTSKGLSIYDVSKPEAPKRLSFFPLPNFENEDVDTNGKILFIEDIGEHYYHVDRLLLNLKRSGQLSGLKGLLVGQFTDMEDTDRPFGQTLEEIVMDKVADYDYPVAFNFPCGHDTENVTLPLGIVARLEAGAKGGRLAVLRGDPV
jgi:muramoyltetrapeptide carboxypeptidase